MLFDADVDVECSAVLRTALLIVHCVGYRTEHLNSIFTDGLLLIAEKAPEPPAHPPGIPAPRTGPMMTSAAQSRAAASSQNHTTSSEDNVTSLKAQAASVRPDHVGEEEVALGYQVCFQMLYSVVLKCSKNRFVVLNHSIVQLQFTRHFTVTV